MLGSERATVPSFPRRLAVALLRARRLPSGGAPSALQSQPPDSRAVVAVAYVRATGL